LAIDVLGESGGRIKRADAATVWQGVRQCNDDVLFGWMPSSHNSPI
jgi:hypothetical protein